MKQRNSRVMMRRILLIFAAVLFFVSQNAAAEERLQMSGTDTFVDEQAGLMWQFERSKRIKDRDEAMAFVSELNDGKFTNWRFPGKKELFELFQVFDLKNNGEVRTRLEGNYWLNDEGEIMVGSWEIGDGCGPSRTFYVKKGGYVRAVRSIR